jgi:hypothetical protein
MAGIIAAVAFLANWLLGRSKRWGKYRDARVLILPGRLWPKFVDRDGKEL